MGLFDRFTAHRDADRAFAAALVIFEDLRSFPVYSEKYRSQLFNIVRILQNGIKSNNHHGDSHVMLSNTFLLIHNDFFPEITIYSKPLVYSAAIIQHWSDEPMRQYPWTKNIQVGMRVFSQVSEIIEISDYAPEIVTSRDMQTLKQLYYRNAIIDTDFI